MIYKDFIDTRIDFLANGRSRATNSYAQGAGFWQQVGSLSSLIGSQFLSEITFFYPEKVKELIAGWKNSPNWSKTTLFNDEQGLAEVIAAYRQIQVLYSDLKPKLDRIKMLTQQEQAEILAKFNTLKERVNFLLPRATENTEMIEQAYNDLNFVTQVENNPNSSLESIIYAYQAYLKKYNSLLPPPTPMTTLNISVDNTSTTAQSATKPAEIVVVSNQASTPSAIPVYDSSPKKEVEAMDVSTGETVKIATVASEPIIKAARVENEETGQVKNQQLVVNAEGQPVATVISNSDGTPKIVASPSGEPMLAVSTIDVPIAVQEAVSKSNVPSNARVEVENIEENNTNQLAKNTTNTELGVAVGVTLAVSILSFVFGK